MSNGHTQSENGNVSIFKSEDKSGVDLKNLFSFNGNATQINSNTAQLTDALKTQRGSISGIVSLDMRYDFNLDIDVNLGNDVKGADGIAIAFHQDDIGKLGEYGGGLGIRGLKNGIGFELDTFSAAPDDNDPAFNHKDMKGAHAGFVSTDKSKNVLTALAPMQQIRFTPNQFKKLVLNWNSERQVINAKYDGQTWELKNPSIDKTKKYTFTIGASTGLYFNKQTVRVNSFEAVFTKPELKANDIELYQDDKFDPFDKRIGLNAYDKVDGNLTNKIAVVENNVNTAIPGKYKVTYEVKNSVNEVARKTINVTVFSKPELKANDIGIYQDDKFDPFDERIGLSAYDEVDGDLTDNIAVVENNVNTAIPGKYKVTYEVKNKANKETRKTISVTVYAKPELKANDIEIYQDEKFDPFDERIGLSAYDEVDGDLTNKITVAENNVDTAIPGKYKVTYEVKNKANKVTRKTINVTVKIHDTWPGGTTDGWKMFSGEDIELVKDPVNALVGEHTFYADKHASIYKRYTGKDALEANQVYRATVYFKPMNNSLVGHYVKLALKSDPSGKESREIFNTTLANAIPAEKGYYCVTTTFEVGEDETDPLIVVENYQPGYIGSVNISKVNN
nr:immunoglobulin-like domain-containing protein [Enterococcus sp. DIV0869a]